MEITLPRKRFYLDTKKGEFVCYSENDIVDINEEWKELPFRGHMSGYMISNIGRVKGPDGQLRKLYYDKDGYTRFNLYIPKNDPVYKNSEKISYPYKTHRAVAELFVINHDPNTNKLVMHLNDIPDCNIYLNLIWGTGQMNMDDKKNSGRSKYLRGEEKTDHMFTEDIVREVCDIVYNKGIHVKKEIIHELGYDDKSDEWKQSFKNLIHNIIRGHCWKYIRDEYIS